MCQNQRKAICHKFIALLHADFVELDKMQVNIQGVEHDLRRIDQIYSKLYNNEDAASM